MRKELIWKDWKVDLQARQPYIPVERTLKQGTCAPVLRFLFRCFTFSILVPRPMPGVPPTSASRPKPLSEANVYQLKCASIIFTASTSCYTMIKFDFQGFCRRTSSNRFIMLES